MRRNLHGVAFLLCVCLLAVGTEATAGPLTGAKWVWHANAKSSVNVPAGKWFFRRPLVIPGDKAIRSATCTITADNAFTLFLNGKKIGSGDNWQKVSSFDVKTVLNSGKNVLAVEAVNWDGPGANPAGWIASLHVRFADGK
ncbi:MAG: hypothetical protein QGF59_30430, partial [Pirellulaceae bacterium]|nr:hypothetical protein [Pirellulaceae bacterium]